MKERQHPDRIKQMNDLKALLERAGKEFFAKGININVNAFTESEGPNGDPDEYVPSFIVDGSIHVHPAPVKVKTLKGESQVWGYVVEKIVDIPATRDQPGDTDYAEVGRYRGVWEVLSVIVRLLADLYIAALNDSVVTAELAAEYQKEQHELESR